jgi:glycosyltransferase involved in cell wall biosynthesis
MPKVSVLMSVYNKGAYLDLAIRSVLDQSFKDFEFIIKDNHSTDNSIEIISSFSDHRIKFAKNSRNLGPGGSLNNCIGEAQGEFVVIAHGDDIWNEDFLSVNMDCFLKYPTINISHSQINIIDSQDCVKPPSLDNFVGDLKIETYNDVLTQLFRGNYIKTPSVIIRRAVMEYFDIRYMYTGDWNLYLNLAADHENFMFINKPLLNYRVSTGSETAVGMKGGDLVLEDFLTLRNFFNNHPEYKQHRNNSLRLLSQSILKRSRYVDSRETLSFYLCCVILCYPLQVFNPILQLYIFSGILFGPSGVRSLKNASRCVRESLRLLKKKIMKKSIGIRNN